MNGYLGWEFRKRLSVRTKGFQYRNGQREGHQERTQIGYSLTHLHSLQLQEIGKHQYQRDEKQSLAGRRQDNGSFGLADGLQKHVAQDDPCSQRKRDELPAECFGSYGNDLRVFLSEPGHDFRCVNVANQGTDSQEDESHFHAVFESLEHPAVQSRAIVESADRLKTLSETNHKSVDEHADTGDDRHSGNGCISEVTGCHVQQNGRNTGQSLTAQ